jgi:hypothetical protein
MVLSYRPFLLLVSGMCFELSPLLLKRVIVPAQLFFFCAFSCFLLFVAFNTAPVMRINYLLQEDPVVRCLAIDGRVDSTLSDSFPKNG